MRVINLVHISTEKSHAFQLVFQDDNGKLSFSKPLSLHPRGLWATKRYLEGIGYTDLQGDVELSDLIGQEVTLDAQPTSDRPGSTVP